MKTNIGLAERLAGLSAGAHLCCLYETEDEHRAVLAPYLRHGIERGEKVLYIVDAHTAETVLGYLHDSGLDIGGCLANGQLQILTVQESYMRFGAFDPQKMIALLRGETEQALKQGYSALRVTGEMTWQLHGFPGSERLIEYECKLNDFFPGSKCLAICQYDRRRFEPALLLDVVSTHPTVVVGTEIYDNFYYTPPNEFLGRNVPGLTLRHWLENLRVRQEADKALKNSELRFRKLLEAAPDAMVIVNSGGRVALVNSQTELMFGHKRDDLLGQRVEMLIPKRFHVKHREGCARYFASAAAQHMGKGYEMFGLRKDGTEFPIEVTLSPMETEQGTLVSSAVRDLTERKRLEEQLLQSQKMEAVGRLAGGVAHDFNNLLTVITGYSDQLLEGIIRNDPLHGKVAEIQKAADRATSLTRQMLAFSRRQVLAQRELNLNIIAANADKMLRRLIGEDVKLLTIQEPALGRVKADPGQIEQIILNMAVNARDAMPQGGALTIETANVDLDEGYARQHVSVTPGPYVMLAVSDTGCGMDAETRSRIFEPFFTTKPQGQGTGLGLATVYGIVKQSGGNICVHSEPNRGTTFKVYLPRLDETIAPVESEKTWTAPPGGAETILLVEDEEAVRSLIRGILESKGYKVLEARNGEDAFLVCEQHKGAIHLLLTDVVMPEVSGRELAERLAPFRRQMEVLYMSGYTDDAVVHHGVVESNASFLQKPFSPDALARKVREVLDSRRPS